MSSIAAATVDLADPLIMQARTLLHQLYNAEHDIHIGVAPGRVNLIGEHTDYNNGFVMPLALQYHTVVAAHINQHDKYRLFAYSEDKPVNTADVLEMTPAQITQITNDSQWHDYVRGVISQYINNGHKVPCMDIVVVGNVPLGAGLSSSAALEVGTAMLCESVLNLSTSLVDIAKLCQRAEHDYAHVPCGIMDQFISAMGQAHNTMLIDCRTFTYELVPFDNPAVVLLVCNSNVKHALGTSEYSVRRQQCESAVKTIQTVNSKIESLRDVSMELLESCRGLMNDTTYSRALHVVSENARTVEASEALKQGDYTSVGKLMTQSHVSLKNDYEVSCDEIDTLVDIALSQAGVYGCRITGGGFGGCALALVDVDKVQNIRQTMTDQYKQETGKQADVYITAPSAGAAKLHVR